MTVYDHLKSGDLYQYKKVSKKFGFLKYFSYLCNGEKI